ncbi:hypothetical protein B484DRAFT_449964, partial [Ochromonadaceae sp. CCMP2298]
KNWDFLKAFVLYGGLEPLTNMIDHENLYLRGQVLEILLRVTDCDVFDWFRPPVATFEKRMHQNLLDVGRNQIFLTKLMANRVKSYPGGAFRALQLMAFSLSWIRALYTADQKLQLSASALVELRLWAEKQSEYESEKGDGEDPELQLARTLLDDFGSAGSAGSGNGAVLETDIDDSSLAVSSGACATESKEAESQEKESREDARLAVAALTLQASAPRTPSEQVQYDKTQGNDLFKEGKFEAAIECYQRALQGTETHLDDAELRSALRGNAATAWWKIAMGVAEKYPEAEQCWEDSEHRGEYLRALKCCEEQCSEALALHELNAKAAYRLTSVLLQRGEAQAAVDVVKRSIGLFEDTIAGLQGSGAVVDETSTSEWEDSVESGGPSKHRQELEGGLQMLKQIRRRCIASLLLSDDHTRSVEELQQDLGLSDKANEILRALLVQYQIELDLPAKAAPTVVDAVQGKKKKQGGVAAGSKSMATMFADQDDKYMEQLLGGRTDALSVKEKQPKSKAGGKKTVSIAPTASADAFLALRKTAGRYDLLGPSIESDADPRSALLAAAVQSLGVIWSSGQTLKRVFTCTLEEDHFMLLVDVALHAGLTSEVVAPETLGGRVLAELALCERFSTIAQLALVGASGAEKTVALRLVLSSAVGEDASMYSKSYVKGVKAFLSTLK